MAPAILWSLPGTVQDAEHVASVIRRLTEDHVASAIRRSLPGDVDHVKTYQRRFCSCGSLSGQDLDHMASAMRRSTEDHMAPAIFRLCPLTLATWLRPCVDRRHRSLTGPGTGHRILTGDLTVHIMTGPVTGH
ncbi:hypothetical protein DPMN_158766 [Dreissena polymorpha]|uniref:Uncharacterized protein n=1 Tax=Dreissena polymorpha TaxID=45954 RepID=A0A9D4ELZ7_DREPO|nr:hypothetical protein DPMN_158766 [Dreissena polymorpha]